MKESEKKVERFLYNAVSARGGLCIKLLTNYFIGLPDRLILLPGGRVMFAELKTTGEKPRKVQSVVMDKIKRLGFLCAVMDTCEQVTYYLDELEDA